MYYEKIQYPPPRIFSWSGNMKRAIIIEVLLLFTLGVLIALSTYFLICTANTFRYANGDPNFTIGPISAEDYSYLIKRAYFFLTYGIFPLLAAIADITVIMLVAFKEFPVFKPLVDKYKARKQAKAEAAAIKAETARQARIEQLQAELDELKKTD